VVAPAHLVLPASVAGVGGGDVLGQELADVGDRDQNERHAE